jgi:hypothetical protein
MYQSCRNSCQNLDLHTITLLKQHINSWAGSYMPWRLLSMRCVVMCVLLQAILPVPIFFARADCLPPPLLLLQFLEVTEPTGPHLAEFDEHTPNLRVFRNYAGSMRE